MSELIEIDSLLERYRTGGKTPEEVVGNAATAARSDRQHQAWIKILTDEELQPYLDNLQGESPATKPLYGIPFAIKDNIDLAGVPTTAGCPAYAYTPEQSASVVQRLVNAGAVPLGKTNLDQFATGLVGTRSPYGICRNAIDPGYIAGGSSSGSAVATALGQVSFALGTDTAGSGRIPAAFNGLVGMKPTRGLLSTAGIVPACASLDCVSLFAINALDAHQILDVAAGYNPADPFSRVAQQQRVELAGRFRFGIPPESHLEYFGNDFYAGCFKRAVEQAMALGGEPVEIDFTPFQEVARLLYEGPWVAERYLAIEALIQQQPEVLHPITRQIIESGGLASAVDAFRADHQLRKLKRQADGVWNSVDVVLTPTAGTHYRISEIEADPIQLNTNLGYYTNFMNLLDYTACAIPAGTTPNGMPFGITLFAPAFTDERLLALAARFQGRPLMLAEADRMALVVCGAHMSGLPLNGQLVERDGRFLESTTTAANYRFFALPGGPPERPGLVRAPGGRAIAVEIWDMPKAQVGGFLENIPAPLGIGKVELENGDWLPGFVCEAQATEDARDITNLGSWRRYLAQLDSSV